MVRVAKYSVPTLSFVALLTLAAACGSKKPPTPPSTDSIDAAAADADMPAMPDSMGTSDGGTDSGTSSSGGDTTPAAPASIALPTAAAKVALKGKKPGSLEIKADGTVSAGGKAVGKISGMAMQNADGSKAILTVGSDGAVTAGDAATAYGSFSGDDLTLAKGDKISVGDDGTVTWTTGGKGTPLGKWDNLGNAKKAGALAVAFFVSPPPAEKAPAKPTGKPTGKPKGK